MLTSRLPVAVILLLVGCAFADDAINTTTVNLTQPIVNATIPSLSQVNQDLKIKLKDIPALTFKAGRLATRQRTTPIPQLNCINNCHGELPTSAQCENKGWDGVSVQWKCQANIAKGRKLENTRVRCESFTEGDREYILAGSCALDYSLGGSSSGNRGYPKTYHPVYNSGGGSSKGPLQYIIPVAMVILVALLVCTVIRACKNRSESSGVVIGAPPGQPGGYYGGGGAYPAQPGFNPQYGGAPGYGPPPVAMPHSGGGGGVGALGAGVGGFAAGAATGGLLGYMLGNNSGSHGHMGGGGGGYGTYGGDYGGDMGGGGGGGGYEMSTDFADTVME